VVLGLFIGALHFGVFNCAVSIQCCDVPRNKQAWSIQFYGCIFA